MKKLYILLLIIALSANNSLFSQEYFQQEVNYKIEVKLDDKTHEFSAFETIEYINNSPDELAFIYFHLWPNAYDNNETALAKQVLDLKYTELFKDEELRGYIDSLDFKIDNKKAKWEYDKEHIDICKIILDIPLKPGERISISTPFHVKIPKGVTSRLGHIGQSYQITQWFPKPAVYDKYGWHQMPYLNMGEFYSEFGSFDVSITLPKNYIVGATGDLQNPEEIEWMNGLAEKTAKIDSFDRKDNSFPESSEEFKTIQFKQKNIHDFAWFADKRFNVLKGEQKLPATGRSVTTWALFLNSQAHLWKNSLEYIGDALHYYSLYTGDYPYNHATAVHSALSAGGGMEYPNITVIGNSSSPRFLEMVIMHEVGHNWFYGILGFNEREYPWLDEGINTFFEGRYMKDKYKEEDCFSKMLPNENLSKMLGIEGMRYNKFNELFYLSSARYNSDQQASLHSAEYGMMNYGNIIYRKVPKAMEHLFGYLGEEKFDQIFKSFYEEWKYKHPYPEDVRTAFEEGTDKDLNWFFDDLLQTTKKPDYKISAANKLGFTLKNTGDVIAPVNITAYKNNEILFSNWYDGFNEKKKFDVDLSAADKLVIDPEGQMIEYDRKNNTIRINSLCKKTEPLVLNFAGLIENTERTQINYLPAIGWNNYNKYMLGLVVYNSLAPRSEFEYQLMPMYSFGVKDIAGSANIAYNIMPYNAIIQNLKLKASAMQYAYSDAQGENFQKYLIEADFLFRNDKGSSHVKNHLRINSILASNPEDILAGNAPELSEYYNINFSHSNRNSHYPYRLSVGSQINENFVKSNFDAGYKIVFPSRKSIDFRLYAGAFLSKTDNLSPIYNINLSGTGGMDDYTYDGIFFGRYEDPATGTFLSNQFIANEGAFTTYSPHGRTNEWLVSLNLSSSLPYGPIRVYANAAVFGDTQAVPGHPDLDNYAWEAGVKLALSNNIQVFVPLLMSKDLKNISEDIHSKYVENIRFSFDLKSLSPTKLLEDNL